MRKAIVGVVLLAAVLWSAPTTIRIAMLAAPTLAGGGVLVVTPAGQIVVATLGTGFALVANGGGYSLQAPTANAIIGAKPARQTDGTYLLAQSAIATTLIVHRNGVRQSAGDDYTYDAATKKISPIAGFPWDASDLVSASGSRA
jgi:hypothetical protein